MIDPVFARTIKLVGFDVDGVMTDGGIYLGDVDGRRLEFKRYDIQDGIGISFLRRAGVRVAIVTGRISESVQLRASELGVEDVVQGPDGHKFGGFLRILERHAIRPRECAFVGDDFPDIPLLRAVGLPVCVGNAVPEVRRECRIQLQSRGGRGNDGRPMSGSEIVERGRRVVRMEREALAAVETRLGEEFAQAVRLIADSPGRVVVAGVGKSGLIGHKIAATLTSTGTPASFLHPRGQRPW